MRGMVDAAGTKMTFAGEATDITGVKKDIARTESLLQLPGRTTKLGMLGGAISRSSTRLRALATCGTDTERTDRGRATLPHHFLSFCNVLLLPLQHHEKQPFSMVEKMDTTAMHQNMTELQTQT